LATTSSAPAERAAGRVVFEVSDRTAATVQRWALEAGTDGTGRCTPTVYEPDLTMDAGTLGSLYLGGVCVPRLVAAGLVTEVRLGAAARADLLLRTARSPWNADAF